MILCKDCKLQKDCQHTLVIKRFSAAANLSGCSFGERTDGRKACCATCKNCETTNAIAERTRTKCKKGRFDIVIFSDDLFDLDKMSCDEHEFREEK